MGKGTGEQGQAAVIAAGLIFLFLVVAAVAINVGWWLHDKRDAQNDVDASALAGAHDLPDEGAASATAMTWATKNNVDPADLEPFEFEDRTGDGLADLIRVRVERDPGSLNSNLLDIGAITVKAKAAAARMRAVATCFPPWGVKPPDPSDPDPVNNPFPWGLDPTQLYVFHTSDFSTPGNFGALRLYGNGIKCYREAIENACGACSGGCANGEPIWVDETLQCSTEPGAGGGNTCEPLANRYGGDCHSDQALDCDAATYAVAVEKAGGGQDGEWAGCADRAVPIPIIDDWPPQGTSAPIHILGIATFYIAGWDRKPPFGDVDVDGDTVEDDAMVWGYFLEGGWVEEAWNIVWGYSDDPFAPIRILLVE